MKSYLTATAELLQIARNTLRERVMPQVAADVRYDAAMVANALAIAARELEHGARARAAERALLGSLYGEPDHAAPLAELRQRLCRDLRAGGFGPRYETELRAALRDLVHARLAISNPGYADVTPADG